VRRRSGSDGPDGGAAGGEPVDEEEQHPGDGDPGPAGPPPDDDGRRDDEDRYDTDPHAPQPDLDDVRRRPRSDPDELRDPRSDPDEFRDPPPYLDDDEDEDGWDDAPPLRNRDGPPTPVARPRPRRWVTALGLLVALALGFAGGVAADRQFGTDCVGCGPAPGEAAPLVGTVEDSGDGVLAIRTPDGALVAVRTSPATRVVGERLLPAAEVPAALGRGTPVEVRGVRDADGALTATAVATPD
jgi:hypothetical protein